MTNKMQWDNSISFMERILKERIDLANDNLERCIGMSFNVIIYFIFIKFQSLSCLCKERYLITWRCFSPTKNLSMELCYPLCPYTGLLVTHCMRCDMPCHIR